MKAFRSQAEFYALLGCCLAAGRPRMEERACPVVVSSRLWK
jgi:hypothetical protein